MLLLHLSLSVYMPIELILTLQMHVQHHPDTFGMIFYITFCSCNFSYKALEVDEFV